jgi:hypothetical protein
VHTPWPPARRGVAGKRVSFASSIRLWGPIGLGIQSGFNEGNSNVGLAMDWVRCKRPGGPPAEGAVASEVSFRLFNEFNASNGTHFQRWDPMFMLCPFQATFVIVRLLPAPFSRSDVDTGIDPSVCHQLAPAAVSDLEDGHPCPAPVLRAAGQH